MALNVASATLPTGGAQGITNQGTETSGCVKHDYHDFRDVTDGIHLLNDLLNVDNRKLTHTFPVKLHYVLDSVQKEEQSHIVSWQPHGRCFKVHNREEFEKQFLQTWFCQSSFASFQRQLNIYSFKRITAGPDRGAYYHECFLRGKPFMAHRIQRASVKRKGPRKPASPETEPNFYAMPFLPPNSNSNSSLASYDATDIHNKIGADPSLLQQLAVFPSENICGNAKIMNNTAGCYAANFSTTPSITLKNLLPSMLCHQAASSSNTGSKDDKTEDDDIFNFQIIDTAAEASQHALMQRQLANMATTMPALASASNQVFHRYASVPGTLTSNINQNNHILSTAAPSLGNLIGSRASSHAAAAADAARQAHAQRQWAMHAQAPLSFNNNCHYQEQDKNKARLGCGSFDARSLVQNDTCTGVVPNSQHHFPADKLQQHMINSMYYEYHN